MCGSTSLFTFKAHRAKYLDEALRYIKSHNKVWYTTADDIAEYYMKNYYDQVVAHIETTKAERTSVMPGERTLGQDQPYYDWFPSSSACR